MIMTSTNYFFVIFLILNFFDSEIENLTLLLSFVALLTSWKFFSSDWVSFDLVLLSVEVFSRIFLRIETFSSERSKRAKSARSLRRFLFLETEKTLRRLCVESNEKTSFETNCKISDETDENRITVKKKNQHKDDLFIFDLNVYWSQLTEQNAYCLSCSHRYHVKIDIRITTKNRRCDVQQC